MSGYYAGGAGTSSLNEGRQEYIPDRARGPLSTAEVVSSRGGQVWSGRRGSNPRPSAMYIADPRGIVKTCGLACHDEVARSVAGRGRSCRSDQEPSLTIRSVVGTQPVTNG